VDGFAVRGFEGRYFMWPEEYFLLSKYVDITEGDYLEVGSMCGIIAMSFALRYSGRNFVCVDSFSAGHGTIAGERAVFLRNREKHALKNVRLIEGDSREVLPTLGQQFDVIFIDANHAYINVLADAANAWKLLSPEGFLIFHDYRYIEQTTRAIREFLKRSGAALHESVTSLAVVRKGPPGKPSCTGLPPSEISDLVIDLATSRAELAHTKKELERVPEALKHAHSEQEFLLRSLQEKEQKLTEVAGENARLVSTLQAVESSTGWRLLNSWRTLRDQLAPKGSRRRRLYDFFMRPWRVSQKGAC
jgi:precorrin-6B methylase 2